MTDVDNEIVKGEAVEYDQWVTGLVDLIPTQVYISKDMLPSKTEEQKALSKGEKRKRRLDPDRCLTTSELAFLKMEENDTGKGMIVREILQPSDLKAKFDEKMREIREKQNRSNNKRSEEEQEVIRLKRKEKKLKQKQKKKIVKTVVENGDVVIKSPPKDITDETGKIIFNKFDLIQDPIEKAKKEKKKLPIGVRTKFAEEKEHKLEEMEIDKPEKAAAFREKKRWKDAETRLKGEKVKDDAKLLKRSLKRREQQKAASSRKWAERKEKIQHDHEKKQEKRKENLKARGSAKKGAKPKKKGKPGF